MTTSTSSSLSPDAKEFIPLVQIPPPTTIPLYVGQNTRASVYSTEQQQQSLIYPLIKIPEIEFHIQSSSTNANTSHIVLLPTTGCYPGTEIPTLYPIDYSEQSLINYSVQQPKSNQISSFRSQHSGNNHSSYRNSHYDQQRSSFNNHQNFHSTNSKRISRGIHTRSIQQHKKEKKENFNENVDESPFKFRSEDFPILPINNQPSDKIPVQSFASTDTKLVYITEFRVSL